MHFSVKVFGAIALAFVAASCAPKPEPVTVDVVYDKFGDAVVYECRPSTVPVSPNYPERLPICEQKCPPGTTQNPNTSVAATLPQCVPIPEGSDGGGNQRPNPNTPSPNTIAN
jgi:hypothetical protein